MANITLLNAKLLQNDEFYTRICDIDKELSNYVGVFNNKVVYCNCDGYSSMFIRYFILNFDKLGIKKIIATGYNESGKGSYFSYDGEITEYKKLKGSGSFNSIECSLILSECDIVVTNPPFSLFREYISMLIESGKKFLIVGTENAIVYKNVFPLVKEGKLWTGFNLITEFTTPSGEIAKFGNICWWTNLETALEVKKLPRTNKVRISNLKKYDNYDALNIDKIKDIPNKFKCVLGVPITYIKYHNPKKYEVVGVTSSTQENAGEYHKENTSTQPLIKGKRKYARVLIKQIA